MIMKKIDKRKIAELVGCFAMLVFGVFIVISLLVSSLEPVEQQTLNVLYNSHTETRGGKYSAKIWYLYVENNAGNIVEYKLNSVAFGAFDKNNFLNDVNVGDPITIIVEDDSVLSIKSNGQTYLSVEESDVRYESNTIVGFFIGGAIILVSIIGFLTLLVPKRRYRRR